MNVPEQAAVAVALLHETKESGGHLRDALAGLGARIVYESVASAFKASELADSRADVVVVNLDADEDPALDDLYALLDDPRYRVVFNDGSVSSALSGWDQARWLRHLASKIFDVAEFDPPRPADAEAVPAPARSAPAEAVDAAPVEPVVEPVAVQPRVVESYEPAANAPEPPEEPTLDVAAPADEFSLDMPESPPPQAAASAGGGLLDEVDALLADLEGGAARVPSAPAVAAEDVVDVPAFDVPDLEFSLDDIPVDAISSGTAADADADAEPAHAVADDAGATSALEPVGDAPLEFDLDFEVSVEAEQPAAAQEPDPAEAESTLDWSIDDMLDGDAQAAPDAARDAKPADFGIETMSASEYLAPESEAVDPRQAKEFESVEFSLELVPLEEAVSPAAERPAIENWSDPETMRVAVIRRVWVLGASIGGPEAVREFLSAFPRNYPALFVLAQHLGAEFVDMMARQLGKATAMTVRMPSHGERVGQGEVVIVPTTHRLRVDSTGVVRLEKLEEDLPYSPSIDRVIEDAAEGFGDAAGAIIFSGVSDDAVRGCRALAQKGGRIYTQSADTCVVSAMVDAVTEAGVVSYAGSPAELAEKLLSDQA